MLLALLAMAVALLGGSSRPDAIQLVVLRPVAVIFVAIALYSLDLKQVGEARPLLIMLCVLAGWMLFQVVPLPPAIWHAIPGREPIVAVDAFLGFDELWRPVALNPWRGWNALASLLVPAAALLIALSVRAKSSALLLAVAAIGVFDTVWGLLQVASSPNGPMYVYEHSNRGSAIGVFANENHSAVFSACALLVIARLATDPEISRKFSWLRAVCAVAFVMILTLAMVGGSRAGFVAVVAALLASTVMIWTNHLASSKRRSSLALHRDAVQNRVIIALAIALVLALPAIFIAFGSVPAFSNIIVQDPLVDLRWQLWDVSLAMAGAFWTTGIGFGSYEQSFHMFEPAELLRESYVNQAHNDWIQFLIEGGIVGVGVLLTLLIWAVRRIWRLRSKGLRGLSLQTFWLALFAIIAFASAIDYPLRAPVFQLVAIWLLLVLAFDSGDCNGDNQQARQS